MAPSSLLERIRYLFDNTLSKGPLGLLFWLALFVSIVILSVSIFVWTMGVSSKSSILEQAYIYMISSFGAADADTDGTWLFRFASLFVMFSGIFVMGTLISILTTTIDGKINQLRRGRSRIIESDHTVILGWSEEILVLIKELVIANDNHPNSCITILADADKIEMEDKIRAVLDAQCKTRIVCRSGDPALILDLDLISVNTAKSIVILGSADDTSGLTIMKTILAIVNNPNRRIEPYHIVTAVDNPKVIDSIKLISKNEVEIINKGEFISKIEAQTLLQAGLSSVITDLLDFEGDEIYFQKQPELTGKSYKEIALTYDTSAVIGFITNKGDILLNPAPDTKLGTNDQIIAISNDDDTIIMSDKKNSTIAEDVISHEALKAPKPINILMLGWNHNSLALIQHLSDSTPADSKIVVAANCADSKLQVEKFTALTNLTLEHIEIDPTERSQLEGLTYDSVDHVAILPCYNVIGNNKPLTLSQLDANTLITLLNIQHIRQKNDYPLTITSEILDLKNRILVNSEDNDDFVVSDHLISLALAQVSENKALGPVFDTLFNPYNSEIYLKPITNYVKIGQPINFLTVVAAGLQQNETVIGYRLNSENIDIENNTVLNPDKQSVLDFSAKDEIIVLAENGGSL